jgi:hypothetical protein
MKRLKWLSVLSTVVLVGVLLLVMLVGVFLLSTRAAPALAQGREAGGGGEPPHATLDVGAAPALARGGAPRSGGEPHRDVTGGVASHVTQPYTGTLGYGPVMTNGYGPGTAGRYEYQGHDREHMRGGSHCCCW